MNKILVSTLNPETYFSAPLFLDEKYILSNQDTPLTQALINRLRRWGYTHVYTDGALSEKSVLESSAITSEPSSGNLQQDVKEQENLIDSHKVFNEMIEFTEKMFTDFVTKSELSIKTISEKIKELIIKIKERRNYLLRISDLQATEKNYIVVHTVKTTILSIAVGMQLKIPLHKLIELGVAALLHEIGMIRLPPQLYMSNRILNVQEKRAITAHTVLGFKILKSYTFPMPVCLTVLEHHEHIDGTGYPRALSGDRISVNAKIIAVCGSYAALVSQRPYREGKDGHASIMDLLKERGKHYDEAVLKALVYSISVFPIGSFVILKNGSKGMVVEPNLDNPKNPLVKIFTAEGGDRLKDPILIKTEEEGSQIVRPLTKPEIEALNLN